MSTCRSPTNCLCGDKECEFSDDSSEHQNFIFTPNCDITQKELIHVMECHVRAINLNLSHGTIEENERLIRNIDWAIKIFNIESKFNIPITKLCTIRGRLPRTGRMRNDCERKLCEGEEIVLTSDQHYRWCSTNQVCYISNFDRIIPQLQPGNIIRIGCEAIVVKVAKITMSRYVTCCIIAPGCLGSYQKLELPIIVEDYFAQTAEEREDVEFVKKHYFDVIIVPSVNRPECFHAFKKQLRDFNIKMIAEVDQRVEIETVDRIIEHFYGVYIQDQSGDYIIKKARESRKLTIAGFPQSSSFCVAADSILLNCADCAKVIKQASAELVKATEDTKTDRMCNNETTSNLKTDCVTSALQITRKYNAKAIVCIMQSEKNAISIASSRPSCSIILVSKCPSMAKRLQLWKNVIAMVYVNCEEKPENVQRKEMMQIVAMYGKAEKIFKADNLVVACVSETDQNKTSSCDLGTVEYFGK